MESYLLSTNLNVLFSRIITAKFYYILLISLAEVDNKNVTTTDDDGQQVMEKN